MVDYSIQPFQFFFWCSFEIQFWFKMLLFHLNYNIVLSWLRYSNNRSIIQSTHVSRYDRRFPCQIYWPINSDNLFKSPIRSGPVWWADNRSLFIYLIMQLVGTGAFNIPPPKKINYYLLHNSLTIDQFGSIDDGLRWPFWFQPISLI